MRLLVLGAGGTGGYFGGRLAAAGADVTFLVRPARAAKLAAEGLKIISPLGDATVAVKTATRAEPGFDVVILACKAFDLDSAIEAIAPAVGPSTLILPLLNGLRHFDVLDARFGLAHVLGGLCHIGATLTQAGEVHHLNALQRLIFGARQPEQQAVCEKLRDIFSLGKFDLVLSENVMQDCWEKYVFLTPYAAMTTLMRAPIGAVMAADEGEALMLECYGECVATASANGYPPRPAFDAQTRAILTEKGSPGTASMLRDIWRNGATEHEHVIGDMLARARAAGLAAPTLRVSLANLQAYDAMRTGRN